MIPMKEIKGCSKHQFDEIGDTVQEPKERGVGAHHQRTPSRSDDSSIPPSATGVPSGIRRSTSSGAWEFGSIRTSSPYLGVCAPGDLG